MFAFALARCRVKLAGNVQRALLRLWNGSMLNGGASGRGAQQCARSIDRLPENLQQET
ncbi:hypothetical protein [Mesorhizobium carmichaelinearum]|uniref:hypothetical protein n=1 Tax=Mesorhizobium carmichaelinearum TaxID=1208188 RepID=UPI0015CDC0DD|nr:hypothetical protein [Mesorhizobium carmichaelinearum]